ncbi:hypothetical protein EYV94_19690 [Puteibacter caeruleilacunae]|nr:hypothetical protein EYV94_19690 [Puteibacter caeruleilacunae]
MRNIFIIGFIIAMMLLGCGPSQQEMAQSKIDRAKVYLQQGDTLNAIATLDSLKMFSEAPNEQQKGITLKKEIMTAQKNELETKLELVEAQVVELEKNFVKEKGEFDRYVQYVPKRQTVKRSWDRSFIQIYLDERGEIYMSSNYYGENWLNHTGLRVYDGDIQAKTEKIALEDVNNHHSDFAEVKWEKVTYRQGKDNGVMEFIAQNADRRLKAVFLGKRYYYIILEEYDKKAVKDALALSKAIKARKAIENKMKAIEKNLSK